MDCDNPSYINGVGFVRCNRCHSCMVNKKKEWSDRLIIESKYWTHSYFVTLTYDPEYMPKDLSLKKDDIIKWKKRLGYYYGKVPQLYYCGEYGSESSLPHWHAVIFGNDDHWQDILDSWDKGNVDIKSLTDGRCRYVAGYVVKKLDKPIVNDGRTPEFYGASRRPPLGYQLLFDILERMASDSSFRDFCLKSPFVPYSLRIGGNFVRLPPYIRNKLKPFWKIYNNDIQEVYKNQKKEQSLAILAQIAKNLQSMHRLILDDDFEFINDDNETIVVKAKTPSWSIIKSSMMDLINERAKNKRRAYDIHNKRI